MIVAIDFDDTWTTDDDAWARVAELLREHGHTVYVVTARTDEAMMPVMFATRGVVDGVYNTSLRPKRQYMLDLGIVVDVWIDDMPEWVCGCATENR